MVSQSTRHERERAREQFRVGKMSTSIEQCNMQKSISANCARVREEEGRGRGLRNCVRVSRNGIVTMNRKPGAERIPRRTVARLKPASNDLLFTVIDTKRRAFHPLLQAPAEYNFNNSIC